MNMEGGSGAAPFGRFTNHILVGGVIGGLLSGMPLLNMLNCCFCILNMAGAASGLFMYLRAHSEDTVSNGEAALFGAGAGAIAGLIASVANLITGPIISKMMAGLTEDYSFLRYTEVGQGIGILMIPVNIALYAGFGALGGFLILQFAFKGRIRR
jgi:hypothetical protein